MARHIACLAVSILLGAACGGSADIAPAAATGSGGQGATGGAGTGGGDGGDDAGGTGPGGGGGSGGTGGTPDVGAACEAAASAFCTKYEECFAFTLDLFYGSVAACNAALAESCTNGQTAPGTGATLDKLAACSSEYAALTCDELQGVDAVSLLPSCSPSPGSLEDGTGCFSNSQCKSTLCKTVDQAACGTCAPRAASGSPCDGGDCEIGLVCSQAGTCTKLADLGDPCGQDAPCAGAFLCSMGICATPPQAGDPCTPMQQGECPFFKGLFCHPQTQTCTAFGMADEGQDCGVTPPVFTLCAASGSCDAQPSGVCEPAAGEGAMCDPDPQAGPNCAPPATCDAGTCVTPSAAACP